MALSGYTPTRMVSPGQRRAITSGGPTYDPYAYERARLEREMALEPSRAANAERKREYDESLALQKEQMEKSGNASQVSGITNLAGTGLSGYMLYKYLNKGTPGAAPGAVAGVGETAGTLGTTGTGTLNASESLYGAGGLSGGTAAGVTGASAAPTYGTILTPGAAATPAAGVFTGSATPFVESAALAPEAATGAAGTAEAVGAGGGLTAGAAMAPYLIPGAAGAVVPSLVDMLHKDSMENLGHLLTGGLVGDEQAAKSIGSTATGAGIGFAIGGPVGGLVGAGAGFISSMLGGCIIVTACTSRDSEEVNITRAYRDTYMTPEQLRGYYVLAEPTVFVMEKHPAFKKFVKKYLVDRIIEYCAWKTGKTEDKPSWKATVTMKAFMGLCGFMGIKVPRYTRINGEVF